MTDQAGLSELGRAEQLMKKEQWKEALGVINSLLELPTDTNKAVEKLERLMRSKDFEMGDTKKSNDGSHAFSAKLKIGHSAIPHMMAMRGSCFVQILEPMMKMLRQTSGEAMTPAMEDQIEEALQHAQLSGIVFHDYPDPLFRAGSICLLCFQPDPATRLFQRVLELQPSYKGAKEFLVMAKRTVHELEKNK